MSALFICIKAKKDIPQRECPLENMVKSVLQLVDKSKVVIFNIDKDGFLHNDFTG